MKRYIAQLSGGKDSTAMVLMLIEKKLPLDEVIFCDTGMEFPEIYEHLQKMKDYLKEKGILFTVLKAEKSFDYWMFDHVKTRGKRIGSKGYGWPSMMNRWCTKELKIRPFHRYVKEKYGEDEVFIYLGIAKDEPKRIKDDPHQLFPLFDWGITEEMAYAYCLKQGWDFSGYYTRMKRSSCWCCPLMRRAEMREIRRYYPEYWKKIREMDRKRPYHWAFGKTKTADELDAQFEKEEKEK